jgi:RNA polymerase sigma-70 factor (ECF subfamily)
VEFPQDRLSTDGPVLAEALEAARHGDRDAVRYLYARLADDVFAYARALVRDDEDAFAIVGAVFTGLGRYEGGQDGLRRWLMTEARERSIDLVRRRGTQVAELPDAEAVAPDTDRRRVERLADAFAHLSPDQREVLLLSHLGLGMHDVAERMARPESAVRTLHSRARVVLEAAARESGAAPASA